jgi:DNA mismatch repair ATPase MutS
MKSEMEEKKMAEYSPMMQHYLKTKEEYKDCILFYRLGDFYEMFFDDAILASRELELTLTGKECGQEERAPMCGVPFHAAETYIARLIGKGYKVAICEQMEDPKLAKGIVKREVIRVVTPGTVIESNLLDEKKNNYIMAIYKNGIYFGISICDVSTGDFKATQIKETNNFSMALDEISRYSPAEIVVNELMYATTEEIAKIRERFQIYISKQEEEKFSNNSEELLNKYNIVNEDGNEIKDINDKTLCICAINGLLTYILETQKTSLDHINKITLYNNTKYMCLDINARRNLELTEKLRDKSKKGTLLWVLDKTSTSMGGRRLRRWLNDPLLDVERINKRLNAVKELKEKLILRGDITDLLKKVYDIERLVGKISYGNANGRDLISLKNSIKQLPELKRIMVSADSTLLKELYEELDTLEDIYTIATIAEDMNYCMPIVDNSGIIDIKGGRHPVIEKILPSGAFVDNDTYLDKEDNRFSIITGPNMAGKSTYMRQVALISLMAQCGSFVPATYARLGVVDKIFTRIGASDDLSMGQSTFMVEMMEVATILKEATPNSLVILDEIGRGTSTYDGLSIAWAVAEYMSDKEKCGAKTLFATHYHELIGLEEKIQGVKNYSIAVKEKGEDIIFLRKIVSGGTDESYGVHVAKLAGVPQVVTKRSNEILKTLERKSILGNQKEEKENKKVAAGQLDMYNYKLAEIAHELDKVDLNNLTPIDALNTLVKIKEKMK